LVGWFVLLLVREEVWLTGLCERKILFQLDRFTPAEQADEWLLSSRRCSMMPGRGRTKMFQTSDGLPL